MADGELLVRIYSEKIALLEREIKDLEWKRDKKIQDLRRERYDTVDAVIESILNCVPRGGY